MRSRRRPTRVRVALLACAALLAACAPTTTTATLATANDSVELAPGWNGAAVEGAPAMPDLVLDRADGGTFDVRAEMAERPTLVYFGYTHCPDICPVHLANISAAFGLSSVRPEQVNVVLVTIDPERDTGPVVDDFLGRIDDSFVGVVPTHEQILTMMDALGQPVPVVEGDADSDTYTMGHPGQVFAFDTGGRARIAYPWGTRQSQWVEDLPKVVRQLS